MGRCESAWVVMTTLRLAPPCNDRDRAAPAWPRGDDHPRRVGVPVFTRQVTRFVMARALSFAKGQTLIATAQNAVSGLQAGVSSGPALV